MARAIDAEKYMELLKEQYLRYKAMKHGEAARAEGEEDTSDSY